MKTNPLLLAALLICTTITASKAAMPGLGVKIGLALANQEFDYTNIDAPDFKYRTGLAAGVSAEFFTDRLLTLVAELNYVQKGFKDVQPETNETGSQPIGELEYNYRFDYLSIPVYAKLRWRKPLISPYIIFGFHYDYLLSRPTDEGFDDVFENYKDDDMGVTLGIGGEYKINDKYTILLEIRSSPGSSYVYKTELLKVTNTSFEILAGVQF